MHKLFPVPSAPPSRLSPRPWPGVTPRSTEKALNLLQENHERWHCYFNEQGFHNHISHWVLALWSLGADESIIEAAYKHSSVYQRPAFKSPEAITLNNFWDHLGDHRYYASYVEFFKAELEAKGTTRTLEEYIFAPEANFRSSKGDQDQPRMLDRFLAGLVHPIIFVGYGVEFGLPGMIIEGLAHAAVHKPDSKAVISEELFKISSTTSAVPQDSLAEQFRSKVGFDSPASSLTSPTETHAFTIVARMLKDSKFNNITKPEGLFYQTATSAFGGDIKKYVAQWSFDSSKPGEVERKVEELIWTNVLLYGVGGWALNQDFNADFFLMHLVTSSLFLPSLVPHMSTSSAESVLRAYFTVSLSWWVAMGRPELDIRGFFSANTEYPTLPEPLPTPRATSLPSATSPKAVNPNPWLPILQATLPYPDDHLPKLQRALSHYGGLFGTRPAGSADFADTELEGADVLDGTLFIRVSGLTAKRIGRVRDDEKPYQSHWDRSGFWKA
ncbi:hypothetical protein AX16_009866 [Volvariella volvacea WC 439]|nr:hypothetical protein AX16_009866 [Volvariella volvacea WC 439]